MHRFFSSLGERLWQPFRRLGRAPKGCWRGWQLDISIPRREQHQQHQRRQEEEGGGAHLVDVATCEDVYGICVASAAVRALQSWLAAAYCWVQLQEAEQGTSGGTGALEGATAILSLALHRITEGRMFAAVLGGVTSDDFETLQLSSECVVTVIAAASKLEDTTTVAGGNRTTGGTVATPPLRISVNNNSSSAPPNDGDATQSISRSCVASIVQAYGEGSSAALTAARGVRRLRCIPSVDFCGIQQLKWQHRKEFAPLMQQ